MEEDFAKPLSPWLTMWVKPRETVRSILDNGSSEGMVVLLAALSGIIGAVDKASSQDVGDKLQLSLGLILILCVVLGAIGGIIALYINAALLSWTGKWIGGQGSFREIKTATAWANIPTIWSGILLIPEILLLGNNLFRSESLQTDSSIFQGMALILFAFVEVVVSIWGLVVYLKCLGEAQKFSAIKAFSNVFLTGIIIMIPLAIIIAILAASVISLMPRM